MYNLVIVIIPETAHKPLFRPLDLMNLPMYSAIVYIIKQYLGLVHNRTLIDAKMATNSTTSTISRPSAP